MSPLAKLQALTQSIYLVVKGRYFDDIAGDDGTALVAQTVDWLNMYLDELETEVDPEGKPMNWSWSRQMGFELGSATEGDSSIVAPTTIDYLLADEGRYVQVLVDGSAVSNFAVVSPQQITNRTSRITEDTCAQVGANIVFSRAFRDYEDGGDIVGDVSAPLPRFSVSPAVNIKTLSIVKPRALLVLGSAKNSSLPDIVQGGLSPSYAQKYKDLLDNAKARNEAGAVAATVERDDYSGVGGVY